MNLLDARLILDSPQLRREQDHLVRAILRAGKLALAETTREGEQRLEAVTRQEAGGKLWRAWASSVSPRGERIARDPVGLIYVKGGKRTRGAIAFLTQSGRVQSRTEGGYLAIPLPAAGSRGRSRDLTPGEWERQTGQRLRFVWRGRGRPALLVADQSRLNARSGTVRGLTQAGLRTRERRGFAGGETTVPIFVLIAPYAFTGRISVETVLGNLDADLARRFETHINVLRDVSTNS